MTINFHNYTVIKECKGNQANKIYIVEEKETRQMMILKLIKIYDLEKQLREIEVHKRLNYKFVIKMLDYDINKTHIILLIEYAKYGDLFSMLPKLREIPEKRLLKFFFQFLQAMDYLHTQGFVHRDIKPENILITKKFSPRLADFGTSAKTDFVKNTFCGTYEYMAPEIYLRHKQTEKVDIWALGILLYEMTHQFTPFKKKSVPEIKKMLDENKIEFRKDLNPLIKTLILRILKFNPIERPSTKELLADPLFCDFAQQNRESLSEPRTESLTAEDTRNEKFASLHHEEIKESDVIAQKVISPAKEIQEPAFQPSSKTPLKKVPSFKHYAQPIPIISKPSPNLDHLKTKSRNELLKNGASQSSKTNLRLESLKEMLSNKEETGAKASFKDLASNKAVVSSLCRIKSMFEEYREADNAKTFVANDSKAKVTSNQKLGVSLKNGSTSYTSNGNSSNNVFKTLFSKLVKAPTANLDGPIRPLAAEKPTPEKKPVTGYAPGLKKPFVSLANLDTSLRQMNNSLLKKQLVAFAKGKGEPLIYNKVHCSIENLP